MGNSSSSRRGELIFKEEGMSGMNEWKVVLLSLVCCLVWGNLHSGDKPVDGELVIVEGGQSPYAIVVPDHGDLASRVNPAAVLLRDILKESTGVELPIVMESAFDGEKPGIFLGKSKAAAKAGLPLENVKRWSYLHQAVGDDVFIIGDDRLAMIDQVYNRKKNKTIERKIEFETTLKAVTAFLENQLGVRFFLPGDYGRLVPKRSSFAVSRDLKTFWKLPFDFVNASGSNPDPVWAVALNLFSSADMIESYGGHAYYFHVPEKIYGEKRPEYFALIGGQRNPRGNHLCVSNPDVQRLMLEGMEKKLDNGYEWILLSQTDGYQACECEECRKIHPDFRERTWIVHRELAEEMKKRRPDKKIAILSYPPTENPPTTFSSFPDNVIIMMSHYNLPNLEKFKKFDVEKIAYIYNWGRYKITGYFGPIRTPAYIQDEMDMFVEHGIRGVYIDGGFRLWSAYGIQGPVFYVFGKMLGDPKRRAKDLFREYLDGVFGEASSPMMSFYQGMYKRLADYCLFDNPLFMEKSGKNHSFSGTPEHYFCHIFTPDLLTEMGGFLKQAKRRATDDKVKERLKMVEAEFDYLEKTAAVFHVYRAYRARPNERLLDLLAKTVDERRQFVDSMYDSQGKPLFKLKGGLPSPFLALTKNQVLGGNRNSWLDKPPFNWNFAWLEENGVLPGTETLPVYDAPNTSAPLMDGKLDDPAWKKAEFVTLKDLSLGKPRNQTRFKAIHDDEALYVGVECELDSLETVKKLKPQGHDGHVWASECVEIMLDPYGNRQRHVQFVFGPVPNSTFDARYGYVEDPAHPLFGKRDPTWNGDWTYVPFIDEKTKTWSAEVRIPFAGLDVPTPPPGSMWTMNVGRTECPPGHGYGSKGRLKSPIFSVWSPNLKARSYHDRSCYGELVLE